jgi:effector-binding domain-containing protein
MLSFRGCSFVETKANMLIRTHPYMTVLYSTRQATLSDLPPLKPTAEASSARTDVSALPGFATFPKANLRQVSGTVVRDLYRYVADLDLLVCGPQYWFYYGVDGKPTAAGGEPQVMSEHRFTVEVALPVQGKIPTALLPYFKRIPPFRCLSSRYEGPWEGIAEEYQRMLVYVSDKELKMSGIYAESFLHIDFDDPANQITEIQIGLS